MSAEAEKVAVASPESAAVQTGAAAPAPAPAVAAAPVEAAAATTTSSAEQVKPKAVFVENLSPSVTTKMLNEFFSLCGPIESITIRPKPNAADGTLEAIVFFESSGAADTAVLLTNAILVDRNINISYFNGADAKAASGDDAAAAAAADGEAPSVWASILAAGYMLGDGIQNAVKEVDQKYGVSKGFDETMDKIDQTLGLSTKAAAFSNAVHQKSDELHVTEKIDAVSARMTQAGESIGRTANSVFDSAVQNPYVNSAWTTLSGWGAAIVNSWTSLTDEANALYAQQTGKPRNTDAAPAAGTTPGGDAAAADPDNVVVPQDASQAGAQPAETSDEVKIPSEPAPEAH